MRVWEASLLFYTAIFAVCEALRYLVGLIRSRRQAGKEQISDGEIDDDWTFYANEFIGTLQVCAPMFDVNLVLAHYGLNGVIVEIAFIELVNAFLLRDAYADPCQLFISYKDGKLSKECALALLGVEFLAGYAAYLVTLGFWTIGIHKAHSEIYIEQCSTDLTTTILIGSLVEAGGLLASKVTERIYESYLNPQFLSAASSLTAGVITVAGINLTGMYANPIVAWACTFNCGDEVSHFAHFVVYWIAPMGAWLAARRWIDAIDMEDGESFASTDQQARIISKSVNENGGEWQKKK